MFVYLWFFFIILIGEEVEEDNANLIEELPNPKKSTSALAELKRLQMDNVEILNISAPVRTRDSTQLKTVQMQNAKKLADELASVKPKPVSSNNIRQVFTQKELLSEALKTEVY